MRIANRSSWKTLPLPSDRASIGVSQIYSGAEFKKIKRGYIPQSMDDKWFIFFDDSWLYFHRSWTGACIYGVRFESDASSICVADAWVTGDKNHYNARGQEYEAQFILQIITIFLLEDRDASRSND